MCPSARYMGRQELNIDLFVNPLEVQTARREGESKSLEKEGEALCLKKDKQNSETVCKTVCKRS